jgi:serine/threonine protein kinase
VTTDFQLTDFEEATDVIKKVLGKGSYGEVRLVQHKVSKQKYAMKTVGG